MTVRDIEAKEGKVEKKESRGRVAGEERGEYIYIYIYKINKIAWRSHSCQNVNCIVNRFLIFLYRVS